MIVSYERTRAAAREAAKRHTKEFGVSCIVVNPLGARSSRWYACPWQVHQKAKKIVSY